MATTQTVKRKDGNLSTWWLFWYLVDTPRAIIQIAGNFLRFGLNYFSIPLLARTLFAPWRQYLWSYPRGFDFKVYAQVFFSNLISRCLGALARVFLIIIAVAVELFLLIAGLVAFCLWLLSFPLAVGLIFIGLKWILGI